MLYSIESHRKMKILVFKFFFLKLQKKKYFFKKFSTFLIKFFKRITFYNKYELDIDIYMFCQKEEVFMRRRNKIYRKNISFLWLKKKKFNARIFCLLWDSIEYTIINNIPIGILEIIEVFWLSSNWLIKKKLKNFSRKMSLLFYFSLGNKFF